MGRGVHILALVLAGAVLVASAAEARGRGGSAGRGGSVSRGRSVSSPGRFSVAPPGRGAGPTFPSRSRPGASASEGARRRGEIARDAELRNEAARIRRSGDADDVSRLRRRALAEEGRADRRRRGGAPSRAAERADAMADFQRQRRRGHLRDRLRELEQFVETRDVEP